MVKITGLPRDVLEEAPGSPGITRHFAFKGEGYLVVRSLVEPGSVSGWTTMATTTSTAILPPAQLASRVAREEPM
jgi:hypothetical protein